MKPIPSKLPHIGTTIFTTMSALAQDTGAVNLGQGFPDFDCDPRLLDALDRATRAGHNQYAPMAGVPALREAIAEKVESLYGRPYDVASEITVTAGATQAIQTALTAIVQPGDEVIVFEPVYDSYEPVVRMNGGTTIALPLTFPDYRPDWESLRTVLTPKTRAVMINTPHNPTATVWSREDLETLAAILAPTDALLISDEVYEHMVYDGARHVSAASIPSLAERAFVISSFGKTYHVTGWKIAYAVAPRDLMAEFRKAHQFVVFTVHTPSQVAIAEYMKQHSHDTLSDFYQAKRDFFLDAVKGSRLFWHASRGTYFVSASYAHLPEFASLSEIDFATMLTRVVGVAAIPISAFYRQPVDRGLARFCFAKREETLANAAHRLLKL
jgi:methionine aminotransferase